MATAKSSSHALQGFFETDLILYEDTVRKILSPKPKIKYPEKNNPGQQNSNLAINAIIANTH